MPARRRTSLARAMSLIEIMVVITLIGLVTAVVGVGVFGVMGTGRIASRGTAARIGRPRDPWGGPFGYAIPGVENPGRLDVRSSGVDRTPMSADDVGNWPER